MAVIPNLWTIPCHSLDYISMSNGIYEVCVCVVCVCLFVCFVCVLLFLCIDICIIIDIYTLLYVYIFLYTCIHYIHIIYLQKYIYTYIYIHNIIYIIYIYIYISQMISPCCRGTCESKASKSCAVSQRSGTVASCWKLVPLKDTPEPWLTGFSRENMGKSSGNHGKTPWNMGKTCHFFVVFQEKYGKIYRKASYFMVETCSC